MNIINININNINKNKHVVLIELIELNSSYFFVFATNAKNKKNIKKRFKEYYIKINSVFFENSNQNKFLIQQIKDKIYDIDKYVIDYMKIYGICKVRGGSYINKYLRWSIILNIKKCEFCKYCGKGSYYCDCSFEEEFYCECCYKAQYFSNYEALKKHEIEIAKQQKIIEKNSICDYCHCRGHYREHCDNVTRWPGKGLKPLFFEGYHDGFSDSD